MASLSLVVVVLCILYGRSDACQGDPNVVFGECFNIWNAYSQGRTSGTILQEIGDAALNKQKQYLTNFCVVSSATKECFDTAAFACSAHTDTLLAWIRATPDYFLIKNVYDRVCKDSTLSDLWKSIMDQHNYGEADCGQSGTSFRNDLDTVTSPFYNYMFQVNWQNATTAQKDKACTDYQDVASRVRTVFKKKANKCNSFTKKMYPCGMLMTVPFALESYCVSQFGSRGCDSYSKAEADAASPNRVSVAVYGDPHLKLKGASKPMTCGDPGWQDYLNNDYFEFRGLNVLLDQTTGATAVTEISLTLYDPLTEKLLLTYNANTGLPDTFPDGTTKFTYGDSSLNLYSSRDVLQRKKVMISHERSGLFVLFREYNGYYSVLLRMSEILIDDSWGMLKDGCVNGSIDISTVIAGRRKKRAADCSVCNGNELCSFDCTVTDDAKFADLTLTLEEDETELKGKDAEIIQANTPTTTPAHAAMVTTSFITLVTAAIASLIV